MDRINRWKYSLAACVSGQDAAAPAILLSNSLGASHIMWAPQMALLEGHFRVIRYDTRGHGSSDAPEGTYSFDDLIADVVAILDHYGVARADFMGLSLGGMTGLGIALKHPDRLNRLICCDARADAPKGFVQSWDERMAAIDAGGIAAIHAGTMERWFTDEFRTNRPDQQNLMDAMFLGTSVTGYKGCAEALKHLDYQKHLGAIQIPTLYVAGSEDSGAPPEVMRAMCEATPHAEFVEIPNAAHIANMDNPAAFNTAISDFLGLKGEC